jgi:hypothetical protein
MSISILPSNDLYLKEILEKHFDNRSKHSVYVYKGKDEIRITNFYLLDVNLNLFSNINLND